MKKGKIVKATSLLVLSILLTTAYATIYAYTSFDEQADVENPSINFYSVTLMGFNKTS